MIGAATAAYFLLTADYGPDYPNPVAVHVALMSDWSGSIRVSTA
ncbi:hypothetical protein DAI22_08g249401 [Oryza sativa Japonica Group]|nr:hypothetical protein DAI22_08g249401 [Oryza sativa Japonica Group]